MRTLLLILVLYYGVVYPQNAVQDLRKGSVSFISSQYVYVKFENTEGIAEQDTLFLGSPDSPVASLIARFISSTSVACERIGDRKFSVNDEILAFIRIDNKPEENPNPVEAITPILTEPVAESVSPEEVKAVKSTGTKISGRISTQSYSNFSNYFGRGNYQRWRHSVRLNADRIEGSRLSFSTYGIIAYRADEWNEVTSDPARAIKIYDLTLGYEFDETARIRIGRHLNRRIANISVVDGIQFEKEFSFLTFGLVGGSRPDFNDFGYNSKLFEYGGYLNRTDTVGNGLMENTLSLFEQTNDFRTDRRFIYLQHTNNILEKTSLFLSSEIDLYKKNSGAPENGITLTSVFISARYAPLRELSFSVSYDARKNVIYYETFSNFIDSVFENETRQGFRFRTNIRPFRNISIGLNYGYRYRKSDPRPNNNYGGYVNFSSVPFLDLSATLSYNRLNGSYLDGDLAGVSVSRYVDYIRSDLRLGFRYSGYTLLPGRGNYNEKSIFADFSTRILNPFYLSLGYEGIFENRRTSGRILLDLSLRF